MGGTYSYTVTAVKSGQSESDQSSSASAVAVACAEGNGFTTQCLAFQEGATSKILVNKAMSWIMNIDPIVSVSQTEWSGTNIPAGTITTGTSTLTKLYTTIGPKTIYATTTGTISGDTYTATCSTTVRLSKGVSEEI